MELRLPSVEQLRTVYDRDLKEAFPAAELAHFYDLLAREGITNIIKE